MMVFAGLLGISISVLVYYLGLTDRVSESASAIILVLIILGPVLLVSLFFAAKSRAK
jgi:hypothetical protein